MITHVVFDFDGTLANSLNVAIALYNEIAEKKRYGKMTADNLAELRGMTVRERCKRLGVPLYMLPWVGVRVGRGYRSAVQTIEFNEGIPELLKELRGRGLELLILSTNDEENIRAVLKRHSAEEWVKDLYCGGGIFGKARRLRALMKRTGLRPEQLVYVGDEHRDVVACKEVGVKVIAVRWGADTEALLKQAGPDYIAEHPAEIAECLGHWSTPAPAPAVH
ncbi:HAD hydrolase-like protein [Archangium violaceum]|uniref:HAD hydrolase-like protein n=1 Tax=Archangium violaceum TaxID=83451 RepID=UPI0019523A5D|nr:HAD hydrolase-like protein [Archangium violaceum]QRN94750.1 HAD hydrolase-like protein [Archangium violaceum]